MKFREQPLIMVVYGTRPEGIKVAPIIRALDEDPRFSVMKVITGQHQRMLDEVDELFGIEPDFDLEVFREGQTLNRLCSRIMKKLDRVLDEFEPDAVLVQGDTSSVLMASITAFNRGIPVVHLEAGLRSGDLSKPFPEEGNRRLVSQIATLHLAPTEGARRNLLAEGVDPASIVVTGNTVVDALEMMIGRSGEWRNEDLARLVESGRTLITVTAHRRENWGKPLKHVGRALRRLVAEFEDVDFVLPLHANPLVGQTLRKYVDGAPNATILPPLDYSDFLRLVQASSLVVSDSGGVQEESPSLKTPLLILRDSTERPEAVESGWARIIGTDEDAVHDAVADSLHRLAEGGSTPTAANPFGDGRASARALAALAELTLVGKRMEDFVQEGE